MSSARWVEVPGGTFRPDESSVWCWRNAGRGQIRLLSRGAGKWPLNEVRDDLDRIRALDKTRVTTSVNCRNQTRKRQRKFRFDLPAIGGCSLGKG